jgi:hypothetical protein
MPWQLGALQPATQIGESWGMRKLARWWSFPLSDDAQEALRARPYLYIYVGLPTQKIISRRYAGHYPNGFGEARSLSQASSTGGHHLPFLGIDPRL